MQIMKELKYDRETDTNGIVKHVLWAAMSGFANIGEMREATKHLTDLGFQTEEITPYGIRASKEVSQPSDIFNAEYAEFQICGVA